MVFADIPLAIGGTLLVAWVLMDAFVTVFMIGGGAGPQSKIVAERTWRVALRLHDRSSTRSHSLMRAAGPLIVLLVLLCWVVQLVFGWSLVFPAHSFIESSDPIQFADRLLFAANAVLGRTGNSPSLSVDGDGWEVLHALAGLSGVFIVSVGLAYVLPILAAVAHKRSVAATIHALGDGVDDMLALGRTSGGSSFELHLVALVGEIGQTAERHRAYPVLHYFHSHDRHAALAPAVAKISLLLRDDLGGVDKVDDTVRKPLERAIANLFAALSGMDLTAYAHRLPDLDGDALTSIDPDPAKGDDDHNCPVPVAWLEAYVRFDGWEWTEVAPEKHHHAS